MIINIGNASLQEWVSIPYEDAWIRWVDFESANFVKLYYDKFGVTWYPKFSGNMHFLNAKFEEFGVYGKYKFKHHQDAMNQLDKFLIRMGKLTAFM